jgi:hypothetical protein
MAKIIIPLDAKNVKTGHEKLDYSLIKPSYLLTHSSILDVNNSFES